MKAIMMTAAGDPEVLSLKECPVPEIQQDTEVLVRLKAAGVNPIDTKLRQRGTFYPDQMPAILGCDGAGVVEAIGSAVQKFKAGDEVYFCHGGLGSASGNYAEWTVLEEHWLARKPKQMDFVTAAAAPLVLITAWEALFDRARLSAEQQVLIQAGAGGVGHVAIQLAKIKGATVCTTVSTEEKAELVYALGADQAILYPIADPVKAAIDWSRDGQGVDLSLDTVGKSILSQCIQATRPYGDVVTLLAPDPSTDWKTARDRNLRVSYTLMLTPALKNLRAAQHHHGEILQQCAQWIDQGKLTVQVSQTFPLERAADAHRAIETGSSTGKIALQIA